MVLLRCANDIFAYCADKGREGGICATNPSDCMHYRKASEVIKSAPEKEKEGEKKSGRKKATA